MGRDGQVAGDGTMVAGRISIIWSELKLAPDPQQGSSFAVYL
jgi:hypothetical protein